MSRNKNVDYTQYIWEFQTENGEVRFAVAAWDENSGRYWRPFDKEQRELTGCNSGSAKTVDWFGGYRSREKALRRARYLFGPILNDLDSYLSL